jgi:hypothetical protein
MFGVVSDVAASYKNKEEAIGYSFRFFTENMMRNYYIDTGYFQLMIDLIPENSYVVRVGHPGSAILDSRVGENGHERR